MIPIFHEDKTVIVCGKPAGVLSQAAPGEAESMLSLLSAQCGGAIYPVHRLDRESGGVMVFARTAGAAAALSRAITLGQLEKQYLCVVQGCPQPPEGQMTDLLFTDRQRSKTFVVQRMRKGVKEASLAYRVIACRDDHTLVFITLHTGRTHQIRVQFASRRLPLAGDRKYGGSPGSLALWSTRLAFPHPVTGQRMAFACLPPAEGFWRPFAQWLTKEALPEISAGEPEKSTGGNAPWTE